MLNYKPQKLLEFIRDGLVEQEHSGIIIHCDKEKILKKIGDDAMYPFFLRSCAKPLQASLLVDFEIVDFYGLTSQEVAISCASHAGENQHVDVVKGFLNKIALSETDLKCGLHKPISRSSQEALIKGGLSENVFQNNCSGKHVMMLAVCKKMGWSLTDYDNPSHPLQISIKNKIYDLCKVDENYPMTKDGCGVPIYSMPLENMLRGYLNLFLDEKYLDIKQAFLSNPYLIGGEERLDTAIMSASPDLIAKVGAGGLCIVINLAKRESVVIKIMDCDMKARAICLINALFQLGWLTKEMMENDLIKAQYKTDILTLHKEKVGEAKICFKF